MKKVFISMPMNGHTNEYIEARRTEIANILPELLGEEIEIIDSFFKDAPYDAKPLYFLGESLKLLSTADVAYFDTGWELARGCQIEHKCAVNYDIEKVIEASVDDGEIELFANGDYIATIPG